ncbi:hypothetical protein K1719_038073 [Acacia pycnantha]|nr:hypothetical protein K1719_038073 [Acacia pycnantha]
MSVRGLKEPIVPRIFAATLVRGLNEDVHVHLLVDGLDKESGLAESFLKERAKNLNDFITRSKKYLDVEQMRMANNPNPRRDQDRTTPPGGRDFTDNRNRDSAEGERKQEPGWDVVPGHQDGLVITGIVVNCRVKRIFVDAGSSADILSWEAFKRMSLDREDLKPCKTTLIGFNGEQSRPKGFIDLRFTLGFKNAFKLERVRFIVAEFVSPYNIILGRPTIHKWDMLVSTMHQKLMVIGNQGTVVMVTGDQKESRQCYFETVRIGEGGSSSQPQRDSYPTTRPGFSG